MLLLASAADSHTQEIKGREILGLRAGGIWTTGGLSDAFGSGGEIEIHFIMGIGDWYGVEFAVSSHSLGQSKDSGKNIRFIGNERGIDLLIYSGTVGMKAIKRVGGDFSASAEAGLGLYVANAIISLGTWSEGNIWDNHFGCCMGAGLIYRINDKLSLDLTGKYHYIFSGDEMFETLYFYSGEKSNELYQISLGINILTG